MKGTERAIRASLKPPCPEISEPRGRHGKLALLKWPGSFAALDMWRCRQSTGASCSIAFDLYF